MSGTWKTTALNSHLITRREDDLSPMNIYRQGRCIFSSEFEGIANPRNFFKYDMRGSDDGTMFIDRIHMVNGTIVCSVRFFGTLRRLGSAAQTEITRSDGGRPVTPLYPTPPVDCRVPMDFHEVRDWQQTAECQRETGSC